MAQGEKGLRVIVKEKDRGGPEKLLTESFDVPEPNDDQILIKIHAAGVNFIDTYHRSGLYPGVTRIGKEGSGTILRCGSKVSSTSLVPGNKVCWFSIQGSYASHVLCTASQLLPIPSDLIDTKSDSKSDDSASAPDMMDIAACIPLQALTAHYLCTSVYTVGAGDTVLVHAGAGGTGGLLIQMCKILGASQVIATVSNETKAQIAKAHGADKVIIYTKTSADDERYQFLDQVKEFTNNKLCNVVFDGVGRLTADGSIASVCRRGSVVFFGNASGPVPAVDPLRLTKQGSIRLCRPKLGDFVVDEQEKLKRVTDVFGWIQSGKLKIRIGKVFELKQAREAHETLEGRKSTGKIILKP